MTRAINRSLGQNEKQNKKSIQIKVWCFFKLLQEDGCISTW